MTRAEVAMRATLTLFVLYLSACGAAPVDEPTDDPLVEEPTEPQHPCRVALEAELAKGGGWDPAQLQACYDGCDVGDENGYDKGRFTCITRGDFCPDCIPHRGSAPYDVGYVACFPDGYVDGYHSEGCITPPM
jgi:hypothetical protein